MIAKIEAWLRRIITEVITGIVREPKLIEAEIQARVVAIVHKAVNAAIADYAVMASDLHVKEVSALNKLFAAKADILIGGHSETLGLKADILSEVQKIHSKLETAHTDVVAATAKAVHGLTMSKRRVCDTCHRVVVAFEVIATGAVKCIDCAAKELHG